MQRNPFMFKGDLSEGTESFGVSFLRSARRVRAPLDYVAAQDATAAAVAYAIAGLPPHQRFSLSSSSEELSSIYGSRHHGQKVEEIEEEFYEELLL
ncbi:hypothetical protein ACFX1X_031474 [Malus domestica]